jgi:two-component system chemotaxis response regulator CheB
VTGVRKPAIRAVVVDDAIDRRQAIAQALQADGDIRVVGHATTGADAAAVTAELRPDVIVLDLQLRDGKSHYAIEQIMARTPTPILVLSNRIDTGQSPSAVEALVAGALEALPTPLRWTPELADELRRHIRQIEKVTVIRHPRGGLAQSTPRTANAARRPRPVIAVAASTGGPSALATVLSGLHNVSAPVLVVQHLHPDFASGLSSWMSRVSVLPVETAQHGQIAKPGRVYLAPSGLHLRLAAQLRLELDPTPEVIHRPSADVLFRSLAEHAGASAIGVLLTGMGEDGARGLLQIHRNGGRTVAQDEATCAVFGMPRAAHRLGAVSTLTPLQDIASAIRRAASELAA